MVKFFLKKGVKLIKNKKGYTLIFIIVILLVISLMLGLTLTLNFVTRAKVGSFDVYREEALYIAEAGVKELIWQFKFSPTQPPNPLIFDIDFENWSGRGEVSFRRDYPVQGQITINSKGYVPYNSSIQVERELEVIVDSQTYQILKWEEKSLEYIK
ncbi:MAG: hypothetical protein ACP5KX_05215 [Caldisericia bacterium]